MCARDGCAGPGDAADDGCLAFGECVAPFQCAGARRCAGAGAGARSRLLRLTDFQCGRGTAGCAIPPSGCSDHPIAVSAILAFSICRTTGLTASIGGVGVGVVVLVDFFGDVGADGRREVVGEWDVAGCAEAADVRAVFVFYSEEGPRPSSAYFGEGDQEGEEGGVLDVCAVDCVEDPVEAEDGVQDHGDVVYRGALVAEDFTEEGVRCVGV